MALELAQHGCEPPCECYELDLGPLQEDQVLLTTEPLSSPGTFCCLLVCFEIKFHVAQTGLKL